MDIEQQLIDLINDPEKVKTIMQLTRNLSPQRKYITSEKGKDARRKSNAKYQAKMAPSNIDGMRKFFASIYDTPQDITEYLSLSELVSKYDEWKSTQEDKTIASIKMMQVKEQCMSIGIPTATSYLQDDKRVHRKVYVCNDLQIAKLLA
jgi:hypothetical protein